jgi:hypothetical protein
MSRFWKRFLREGQRFFGRGPKPQIWLGAFGKHPGWDDHIDDIGLETESLLLAKQILYVDGIGGQVNSGEWERLDGARRLAEFKHIFLWKRGDAFLAGRIWSSRDGKNRTPISPGCLRPLPGHSLRLGADQRLSLSGRD